MEKSFETMPTQECFAIPSQRQNTQFIIRRATLGPEFGDANQFSQGHECFQLPVLPNLQNRELFTKAFHYHEDDWHEKWLRFVWWTYFYGGEIWCHLIEADQVMIEVLFGWSSRLKAFRIERAFMTGSRAMSKSAPLEC